MIKRILTKIKDILITMQKARVAAILARNGKYAEARAIYKD